jgi:hypothetical protein
MKSEYIALAIISFIIIVWWIIIQVYKSNRISHLCGAWMSYDEFAKHADMDSMAVIFSPSTIDVIIVNKHGVNHHSCYVNFSSSPFGTVRFTTDEEDFIFGKLCYLEFDVKKNYLKIYGNNTIYAFCYKDPEVSTLLNNFD